MRALQLRPYNFKINNCAGVDGTIFAYGVTSSGKTHTMTGTPEDQGVIGRAVADVFAAVERMPERDFLLQLSMMEIYNEVRAFFASSIPLPKPKSVQRETPNLRMHCGALLLNEHQLVRSKAVSCALEQRLALV